jgi:hypothetical protein
MSQDCNYAATHGRAGLLIRRAEEEQRVFTVPRLRQVPQFESITYPIFLRIGTSEIRGIVALRGTMLDCISTFWLRIGSAVLLQERRAGLVSIMRQQFGQEDHAHRALPAACSKPMENQGFNRSWKRYNLSAEGTYPD